jgi:3' terminal RNA ribose 2'-O-methyltransferase Hen1
VIITVTTTSRPATDLGYLLHKHPDRVQSFDLPAGTAYVCYPEASLERCTAALIFEVDPIGLVRGRPGHRGPEAFTLGQYVNDRPYAASSLLSGALVKTFRTAMAGRCDARPELAATAIPLELHVPALPCRGGTDLAQRLFAPLGWAVTATPIPLDPELPGWGNSRYVDLRLRGTLRLADALNHVYVLLPVLDDAKHYWVSSDEVDKLIRAGTGWLAGHPERTLITSRYLRRRSSLTRVALARLAEADDLVPEQLDDADAGARVGEEPDRPVPLAELRRGAVLAAVRASGARTVGDLGCGEGGLVADLLAEPTIERVVAVDVSVRSLEAAARRLRLDRMTETQRARVEIFQSSLTYRDERLRGLDAAVLMEVVEHLDPPRLPALERCVFGEARPGTVVLTTPNVEYNVRFETLPPGARRHRDHRFEWTRAEFGAWADRVADAYGYRVRFLPVGEDDPEVGPATQLAIFSRKGDDPLEPPAGAPRTSEERPRPRMGPHG